MICKACKKEFNQYDSPICENCIRKIWDKSNESNTNTWVQYFNVKKPPTLKQKKHLANLYRGFEFDENENYSIHKDFPGHNIEHGAENTCSCGNRCDVLSKYNEFLKILPYNSLHTSPIIYVLKGIRDQYRVDQSKIPFE